MTNSSSRSSILRPTLFILLSSFLAGCVTSTVQEIRETTTGVTTEDTVVVLGKKDRPSSQETELDFVGCVSSNLSAGKTGITAISK